MEGLHLRLLSELKGTTLKCSLVIFEEMGSPGEAPQTEAIVLVFKKKVGGEGLSLSNYCTSR